MDGAKSSEEQETDERRNVVGRTNCRRAKRKIERGREGEERRTKKEKDGTKVEKRGWIWNRGRGWSRVERRKERKGEERRRSHDIFQDGIFNALARSVTRGTAATWIGRSAELYHQFPCQDWPSLCGPWTYTNSAHSAPLVASTIILPPPYTLRNRASRQPRLPRLLHAPSPRDISTYVFYHNNNNNRINDSNYYYHSSFSK